MPRLDQQQQSQPPQQARAKSPVKSDYVSLRDAAKKNLSGYVGTEIVDPRVKIVNFTDQDIQDLELLLAERGVVVLRDQHITNDQQRAFGKRFGDLHIHPSLQYQGLPKELLVVHSDEQQPGTAELYHADVSSDEFPPKISILRIEKLPENGGGATEFVDARVAFDKLSEPLKNLARGLTAIHSGLETFFSYSYNVKVLNELGKQVPTEFNTSRANGTEYPLSHSLKEIERHLPLPSEHPVVRTHPLTGRSALNVNTQFTQRIVGLTQVESDTLLQFFYKHLRDAHEGQIRVNWDRPNSVVLFDHRVVQHAAHNDFWPQARTGWRVTVTGERPFYDPHAEKRSKPATNPNWNRKFAGQEAVRASLKSAGFTGRGTQDPKGYDGDKGESKL